MHSFYCSITLVVLKVSLAAAQISTQVPDSFKIFESIPCVAAVADINDDGELDCLVAKQITLNKRAKTAEYVWVLNGDHGNLKQIITFHVMEGRSPDTFRYTMDEKQGDPGEAKFLYTDYKNCAILRMFFNGTRCILWSSAKKEDSIPAECIDRFHETCGIPVSLYSYHLCKNEEICGF